MDAYEKEQFEKIKTLRYLTSEALHQTDYRLDENGLDHDAWLSAFMHLSKARDELVALIGVVHRVRNRRLEMLEKPRRKVADQTDKKEKKNDE